MVGVLQRVMHIKLGFLFLTATSTCVCMCMYMYMCVHVCVYVATCVCMCVCFLGIDSVEEQEGAHSSEADNGCASGYAGEPEFDPDVESSSVIVEESCMYTVVYTTLGGKNWQHKKKCKNKFIILHTAQNAP